MMRLSRFLLPLVVASMVWKSPAFAAPEAAPAPYKMDFEQVPDGMPPADLLVLAGLFEVKFADGNRFLELPGSPLETFGVMFGPTVADANVTASARFLATKQGRKYPTFAISVSGPGGVRLQVSPAKKAIELFLGDTPQTSVPFDWKDGKWTFLKLSLVADGENVRVQGFAWGEGVTEADSATFPPILTFTLPKASLKPGRSVVWGSPFSGTAIRFDDLKAEIPAK